MPAITKRFWERFRGLTRAYGVYTLTGKRSAKGKVEGKAKTVKRPLTERVWVDHLAGRVGLGVVPVDEEGRCWFGAIDVDVYDLNHDQLEQKIRESELPLILCKTKSGGAHLYHLRAEPITAREMRERLARWARELSCPTSEVFPKQEKIESETDIGNWINMPYFGDTRKAIHEGRELTAEEFLDRCEVMAAIEVRGAELEGAPPCLRSLVRGEIPEGTQIRNKIAFMICLYCKKRHGDGWQKEARYLITKHIPSLDRQEVQRIVNSARLKDYRYKCKEEPFSLHCDRDGCREAGHGTQATRNDPGVTLADLKRIMTEEPSFELAVNGQRLELERIEDLTSQHRFTNICGKRLGLLPRRVSNEAWRQLVQELMREWKNVAAPSDAGEKGQFLALFDRFVSDRALARHQDELLTGKAWLADGRIYLQSTSLLEWLKKKRFMVTAKEAWGHLRELSPESKVISIKDKKLRVWIISAKHLNPQTEPFDVPEVTEENERSPF